jgi:type II secretory pathway component PulF
VSAIFEYTATDRDGKRQRGSVRAVDQAGAIRAVRGLGLTPVRVGRGREGRGALPGRGVSRRDVLQLTHELGTLLDAAVPIGEGLRAIAEQESGPRTKAMVLRIAQRVESGSTVTEALREHERAFGPVYLETIAAAERSGTMRSALAQLAEDLEWQLETGRRIHQSLMYPAAVATALIAGTSFLLAFVAPKFTAMFAERGVELPALTRALDTTGRSLQGHWWIYLGAVVAFILAARAAWATSGGRLAIDTALHKVPVLRRALRSLGVTRFARTLGMSLSAGIDLMDALEQAGRASGRPTLARETAEMARRVRAGSSLREALTASRYLPIFAKRMLTAGEEAAELPRMCGVVARRHEREAEHLSRNLGTLIEPVLIAALTTVVLVVALGIFLPMWDMAALMR